MLRKLFIAIVTVMVAAVLVLPAVAGPGGGNGRNHDGGPPASAQQHEGRPGPATGKGCYPPGRGPSGGKAKGAAAGGHC